MTAGLPLIKSVLTLLAKSVLLPFGLLAAMTATDAAIQNLWIYGNAENVTYFNSFGVENIPKEIRKLIENRNIIKSIYRMQVYHQMMCVCFCNGFIDFILKGKTLLEYANLFSQNE